MEYLTQEMRDAHVESLRIVERERSAPRRIQDQRRANLLRRLNAIDMTSGTSILTVGTQSSVSGDNTRMI